MSQKEKLKIAARIIFSLLLIVAIAWEFIEPHENKFRSFGRIVLWVIFLISQLDHLYTKLVGPEKPKDL